MQPPQLQSINNIIKNGIHDIMSISHQDSPNAKNKKNNTIIHHAPPPKNPSPENNLSNIVVYLPLIYIFLFISQALALTI